MTTPPKLPSKPPGSRPPKLPSAPPSSRPLTKLAKRSSFPPDEALTTPNSLQYRSAELVKDWAQSLPEHKKVLERMARHYADLAKRKRAIPKGE